MGMPMTAEDVVVGIFCQIEQHIKKITADRETLHRAFFETKRIFPEVMSLFTFRQREQFPESEELDQALSNLDAAGLITRQNLTPRYYCFETSLSSSYGRFSSTILSSHGIDESKLQKAALKIEEIAKHP